MFTWRMVTKMKCILIFDHLNDLIYSKCDSQFGNHLKKLARIQGLLGETAGEEEEDEDHLSANIVMQLFSPIVTSQRIMSCQFGNSYSSVGCQDGTNMVFDEYLGYLFMHIGTEEVSVLKRSLATCIVLVQHICGPDVSMLKRVKGRSTLLSRMLDIWSRLRDSEQSFLVEAVEQLSVNSELTSVTLKALQEAADRLKSASEFTRIHCLIFVENKFLSLFSSRGAQDLSSADILFLAMLAEASQPTTTSEEKLNNGQPEDEDGEFFSPQTSPTALQNLTMSPQKHSNTADLSWKQNGEVVSRNPEDLYGSYLVLLMGLPPGFNPHVVHVAPVTERVSLVMVMEAGNPLISSGLWEGTHALSLLQSLQLQRDLQGVRQTADCLDFAVKKVLDGLKKIRSLRPELERCHRKLTSDWEFLRKKYNELVRSPTDVECVLRVESCGAQFAELFCEVFRLSCLDQSVVSLSADAAYSAAKSVRTKMADFSNFLKVKALRNFTLGSRTSLSINKYLEEFPGLVHFIYIDRSNHRVTAPSLDFSSEETISLTKKKIWSMVEFCRAHLIDGHIALMWKDTTFNYAYFLWFEDTQGSPLRPKVFPTQALKSSFPLPGILCGDFYQRLVTACFPKLPSGKVRCYELFCIHLGLATSSCVLEHSRRLAATIWEVTGIPSNPADLL